MSPTPRHRLASTLLPLLLLAGCPIGNNKFTKPSELSPSWRIDKLRVLAVRADPPEAAPGELVRFEALVTDPDGEAGATVWLACPTDGDGVGFGCPLDPSFDFANATPDELEEAGFIGFEPVLAPRYVPDAELFDGLDEAERVEGVYVLVQIAVLPQSVLDGNVDGDSFDFNQVEVAYKRLVVSEDPSPNANPDIAGFLVDDVLVPPGATFEVDPGETYEIGLQIQDGAVEAYRYVNPDGDAEDRIEEPYAKWYTRGGVVEEDTTLFPFLESTWRAPSLGEDGSPPALTSGTIWAVVRDRRGGIAWAALPWSLRP